MRLWLARLGLGGGSETCKVVVGVVVCERLGQGGRGAAGSLILERGDPVDFLDLGEVGSGDAAEELGGDLLWCLACR